MNVLIFGANGQDGYYLTQLLENKNIEVIGVARSSGDFKGDVADYSFVESMIKQYHPAYVFHFAANSTTRHSALFDNHQAISTGTLNILESVRLHSLKSKVFLSGSAMQFKNEGLPINESSSFEASSPYSVARIQSVYAARYYRSAFGLNVYVGYFFNHDSPLRTDRHINQKIASFVKKAANGSSGMLELGNVKVKKEFNYAGDVVEAIWILVNQDIVFEAVIGSGHDYSIQEWVDYCFEKVGKDWHDYVTIKEGFVPEYQTLVSDPRLIQSLGWKPKVNFYGLADMMMEDL